MCLIVARGHAGPTEPGFPFDAAWSHNSDGFGIAWSDGKKIFMHKTLKKHNAKRLLKLAMAAPYPFIAHFRFRTRGLKTVANVHPFRLGRHSAVMAHNGTLETAEGPNGESDSVMFTRNVLSPLADVGGVKALFDPKSKIATMVSHITTGSRLALLRGNGDMIFYGAGWSSWRDLMCSNAYSLTAPVKYEAWPEADYAASGNVTPLKLLAKTLGAYSADSPAGTTAEDYEAWYTSPHRLH